VGCDLDQIRAIRRRGALALHALALGVELDQVTLGAFVEADGKGNFSEARGDWDEGFGSGRYPG
jgi:hypothetical protein